MGVISVAEYGNGPLGLDGLNCLMHRGVLGVSLLESPIAAARDDIERREVALNGQRDIKAFIYVFQSIKMYIELSEKVVRRISTRMHDACIVPAKDVLCI